MALGRPEGQSMSDFEHVIRWVPLPSSSRRRVNWDRVYEPLAGLFHAGATARVKAEEECTPQRLTSLRTRADEALTTISPEFDREAARLRRERYVILGTALTVSLILVVVSGLNSTTGYELIKTFLAAGGTGGSLSWGIATAFRRADQETQLKLFPTLFAAEFDLCADCDAYQKVFERFARAVDALRGVK
jgi:hypothetical protein